MREQVAMQPAMKLAPTAIGATGHLLQRKCDCGNHTTGEACDDCAGKKSLLQRKATNGIEISEVAPIVHEVLRCPGQPLDEATRTIMESRFGHDFSRVQVHTDAKAGASADAVAAEAYTVKGHLVFGAGHYRPATEDGRQLIAHELTHVLQQGEGPIPARLNLGTDASPLERQADMLSREVPASGEPRWAEGGAQLTTERGDRSGETMPMGSSLISSRASATSNVRRSLSRQQALGVHDSVTGLIQRRRVPGSVGLGTATPTSGPGFAAAQTGLARLLSRAWAGMTVPQQSAVKTAMGAFTWTTEANLLTKLTTATRVQLIKLAQEIRTVAPSAELGDPLLIDVGARPGTSDAANITTLVNNANTVLTTIAGGTKDSDLTDVFGAANVATAKTKYSNAKAQMNTLKGTGKIVTDRSGYSGEVGLGGLSNSAQISVMPSVIDNPGNKESVITLIHESMHAGNSNVRDFGYITQPSFKVLAASVKLTNAAHFEVVPRRILAASHAFPGVTFTPAGTGGTSSLTPREQAIRDVSEMYRAAWTAGLRLHKLFVRVFRTPTEWNTLNLSTNFSGAPAGAHFADTLPFWSKVEMLTIHTRPAINPAGTPAVKPVTLVDIALSEGLIRKLSQGMRSVPATPAAALALETAKATAAERTAAAASSNAERDLLVRLVLRVNLGSITGAVSRDERVVARLAQAAVAGFSDMLAPRPPSAFP